MALDRLLDSRERPRGDPVDEDRPDHEVRRERADERPSGTGPVVHDRDFRTRAARNDLPYHVHHLRDTRSEEHTSELQSPCNLVCRLLLEKKKKTKVT